MNRRAGDGVGRVERLGAPLERADARDFPYYDGRPVALTGGQWALVVLSVVVGFACLVLGAPLTGPVLSFVPAVLFAGLPLAALAMVAGPAWRALFARVGGRDVATMAVFAVLNIVVTSALGLVVASTTGAAANPQARTLERASAVELAAFYPRSAVQLLGEELVTVLPFLALLWWLTRRGLSRNRAVLVAWVVTAVWFGLLHLPTYDFNLVQCLVVIGGGRLVLTLAYIRTKNLWVSTGAHILNDWVLFTVPLVIDALA